MKLCDLHTHSVYSDGTLTPAEIIKEATELGLSAVALCDHNTVDGVAEFLIAAEGKEIEAIAGAEFSCDYNGTELHLLGLYIPPRSFDRITETMKHAAKQKMQSNVTLIESLNRAGYKISLESVAASTPNGNFNRAHIAAELTKLGYTESIDSAFQTLLSPEVGHYREPRRTDFFDMISFVRSVGAVPVLAHPFYNLGGEELEILLPVATQAGLIGMECYYSEYDEETTDAALRLADKYGIKYSGGSDFHGENKPDIKLGFGKGNLRIPYEWSVELKKYN